MPISPPVDPRLLAAEIEASVAEFNHLVNLADELGVRLDAELQWFATPDQPLRPWLAVCVTAPI